jgi:hypothetical protein
LSHIIPKNKRSKIRSGGCSIYSLKANLSPKKRHKHYIASNAWDFRSGKKNKITAWNLARPCSAWHRPYLSLKQNSKKEARGRARLCVCRHGLCQAPWSSKARLFKGPQPGLCQARLCLIFFHMIFIYLASIVPKSCSRSFHSLTILQNPFLLLQD